MAKTDAPTECSREIPWQTVFFWMACFALNAMTQPTGRVLGLAYRPASILRSSPVLCAFDATNVVVALLGGVTYHHESVSVAAAVVLNQRILNKDGLPDAKAIERIKKQSTLRWFTFCLGALPQFIKLFASGGITWSQALGAMYLASWLLFEFVVLMADLDENTAAFIDHFPRISQLPVWRVWTAIAWLVNVLLYNVGWMCIPNSRNKLLLLWTHATPLGRIPILLTLLLLPFQSITLWSPVLQYNSEWNATYFLVSSFYLIIYILGVGLWVLKLSFFPFVMMACASALPSLIIAISLVLEYELRFRKKVHTGFTALFCILVPLAFYSTIYDSKGTYQP